MIAENNEGDGAWSSLILVDFRRVLLVNSPAAIDKSSIRIISAVVALRESNESLQTFDTFVAFNFCIARSF